MNIIEARQSGRRFTGSAVIGRGDKYWYVNNEGLILDDRGHNVPMHIAFLDATDYELYTPEIRPKEAGEFWFDGKVYYHTDYNVVDFKQNGDVFLYAPSGHMPIKEFDDIIHGQNGWERLHPKVEDCERMEIVGITVTKEEDFLLRTSDNTTINYWGDKGKLIFIPKKEEG